MAIFPLHADKNGQDVIQSSSSAHILGNFSPFHSLFEARFHAAVRWQKRVKEKPMDAQFKLEMSKRPNTNQNLQVLGYKNSREVLG